MTKLLVNYLNPKHSTKLLGTLILFFISHAYNSVIAAEAFDASISKVTVSEKMIVGKSYSVKVKVNNTGSTTWTRSSDVALALTKSASSDWDIAPVGLDAGESVKSGDTKLFSFSITANSDTGIYPLQFELQRDGKPFGQPSQLINIIVETATNRVGFISQLLPNSMNAGQKYSIVVQFKNEGTVNWSRRDGYQLGLKTKSAAWDIDNIKLDNNDLIAPGDVATFRFDLTAPNKPDTYDIQWQMLRWNKWFGEPSDVQQVTVIESGSSSGAEFVYQNIPGLKQANQLYAIVDRGDIIPVNITFKNTSEEVWTEGRYSLNSQNPANNLIWSLDRIDLKPGETIKPGQIKTFNFNIIAPIEPGIYQFQWQMLQGFNNWIGEKTEPVVITVK